MFIRLLIHSEGVEPHDTTDCVKFQQMNFEGSDSDYDSWIKIAKQHWNRPLPWPNLTSLLLSPPLIRSPDVRGLRADATVLEAASWKGPASARSVLCSLLPVLTLHFLLILSALPVLTTWAWGSVPSARSPKTPLWTPDASEQALSSRPYSHWQYRSWTQGKQGGLPLNHPKCLTQSHIILTVQEAPW